jgi:hypothetical protein
MCIGSAVDIPSILALGASAGALSVSEISDVAAHVSNVDAQATAVSPSSEVLYHN